MRWGGVVGWGRVECVGQGHVGWGKQSGGSGEAEQGDAEGVAGVLLPGGFGWGEVGCGKAGWCVLGLGLGGVL